MPGCEMGTQWGPLSSRRGDTIAEAPNETSDQVKDYLKDLWFRLPKSKTLQAEGINQLEHRKSNIYLHQAMNDVVQSSLNSEYEEKRRVKQHLQKLRKQKKSGGQRYLASEAEHPINLQYEEYLTTMPKSWADERKKLERDLKKKVRQRTLALKPKILSTSSIPKLKSLEFKLDQVRSAHSAICEEALQKTISVDRKKQIRADLSDMDLWNRPMFHLKTPLIDKDVIDPLEGAESLESMYSNVRRKVSAETLNNLLNPEPDLEEFLQDYFKTHAETTQNPNEKEFKTKAKANLTTRPRLPDDQSSVASGSEASTFAEYGVGPTASSGFGLHCLRELVKFQDDSWNLQEDSDGQSNKIDISSSSGSSVSSGRQKQVSAFDEYADGI